VNSRKLLGFALVVLILGGIVLWYVNSGKKISPVRETAVAPESIGGTGVEGTGGDALLNTEKNRYTRPLDVTELTPSQMIAIPANSLPDAGRKRRANWPGSARDYAESQERRGVRLTGYLVHAKESGPESCNGYSDSLRDYHIWVSDAPTDEKSSGVIVEITPRWKAVHPEWRLRLLERLAHDHAKVRVSGWLMWDEEHPDEVGRSRATQWEVHPVTGLEIFSNGTWQGLED